MSQHKNESETTDTTDTTDKPDTTDFESLEPPRLPRCKAMRGPLILTLDSDLYILSDGHNKTIKSWITDKPVSNRRLNEKTGYLEKIDPTIEEEDRRLLIPNAILAENYTYEYIKNI
jgi:hypothetical protein